MVTKQSSFIEKLTNFPELVFPVAWGDENAQVDEETADEFKKIVYGADRLVLGLSVGLGFVLGGILFFAGIFMCIFA